MQKIYIFLFLFFIVQHASSNEVSLIQVKEDKNRSIEISFSLDKVSYIKSYSLTEPSRIIIEVNDSILKSQEEKPFNFPIKQISTLQDGPISRITIDLYEYVNWTKPRQIKTKDGVILSLDINRSKDNTNNIRDIIVSIDPGHGGKDPGAVGENNILEKDINLLIAKELERTLRGVTIVSTPSSDIPKVLVDPLYIDNASPLASFLNVNEPVTSIVLVVE